MARSQDIERETKRQSKHEGDEDGLWLQLDVYQKSDTPKDVEDAVPGPTPIFDGVEEDTASPPAAPAAQTKTFLGMSSSTWATSIGLSVAILLIGLDATIVSVATPQITDDLGGLDDVGWFGSVYFFAAATSQLIFGPLNQVVPHKLVFICGLFLFELGCLLSGLANSMAMCLVGRVFTGLGCSGVVSTSMVYEHVMLITNTTTSLATQIIPANRLGMMMAFMGAMELIGQLIGPLVGGSLTDNVSWRWCFLLNVPIGAACGVVLAFLIHSNRQPWLEILHQLKGLDYLGIVILSPAVVFILFVVNTGGTSYAWDSAVIKAMIILAVVLMAAFLLWERRRGDSALIPARLVKNRNIICAATFAFSNGIAVAVYDYYLPLWVQTIRGYTAGDSGLLVLPLNACTAGGILLGGVLVDKIGFFNPVMLIGGILTSVASGILTTIGLSTGKSRLLGYSALAGLGGLALQQPLTAAHNAVGKGRLSPSAMSLMLFSNMVGSSAGLAIAQAVFMGQLKTKLSSVPGVPVGAIINSGASELRKLVDPQQLPLVTRLYNLALTRVFFIGVAAAICMFSAGLFARWQRTVNRSSAG